MKIGVISDTHIPANCDELPQKVKENFKDVDMILHAGDLADACVLDMLKNICPKVEAVCGNMDPKNLQQQLPQKKIITAGKFKIGLIHGWGPPKGIMDRLEGEFKGVDAIVFGHTHQPVNLKKNGVLFFNPGSPTDLIHALSTTIGILEINAKINGKILEI